MEMLALPGSVLVVEDHKKLRTLLGDVLQGQGHTVRLAEDGADALEQVEESVPDVVLLDLMLPRVSGLEVCRRLKSDPATAPVPILLITALTERRDRLSAIEAGANDFLVKPIDMQDVMLRVRNAISAKRLYDRLHESFEQLRQLEIVRDNLTHMMVHDMKSPLTGVQANLELLQHSAGSGLTDMGRACVDGALASCRRLTSMIASLLDVSRLESKVMPLQVSPTELHALVRAACGTLGLPLEGGRVEIEADAEATSVTCDPDVVRRVIENLVDNALRFSAPSGVVRLAVKTAPGLGRVEVKDSGPGIPPEFHDRIFEKFGHADMGPLLRGQLTGLGLTFCKLAVEAHGGRIGVQSVVGEGSTFWFELPAAEA